MLEGGEIYRLGDPIPGNVPSPLATSSGWLPGVRSGLARSEKFPCQISHLQRLEPASSSRDPNMKIEIDAGRLNNEIDALASITDAEPPAVTRIVFTPTDLKARAWMKNRCEEAGLSLRQDAIGNTFARWTGSDPTLPAVGTGSHIDAESQTPASTTA